MIPALIAPAYNRHDLLARMLASVDDLAKQVLIVNNARTEDFVAPSVFAGEVRVSTPPFHSIGYGGAINLGLTQMDEPWWLWASNDVQFVPNKLRNVAATMALTTEPLILTGGFTWGAINRAAVAQIGLVDDWSFFPIYFDDNDYHYRAALAGVEWREMPEVARHGDDEHPGSVTIRSDKALRDANHLSFRENERRYLAKWGGPPGKEVYTTPWNRGLPIWTVIPDLDGRTARRW